MLQWSWVLPSANASAHRDVTSMGDAVSLPVVPHGSAMFLNWLRRVSRLVRKPLSTVDKVDSIDAVSCSVSNDMASSNPEGRLSRSSLLEVAFESMSRCHSL